MKRVTFSLCLRLGVVWLLLLAALILLAEGAARPFVADPTIALTRDVQEGLTLPGCPTLTQAFDFDADLFWVLKPNLTDWRVDGSFENKPIDFAFSTTASRLRVMPPAPGPERYRILAIGDSCTFGFGVEDEEAWPAQLQTLLNTGRTGDFVRVINAGVPGYTAFQGLQYLKRTGLLLAPNLVLVSFWINDQVARTSISDEERARLYSLLRYDSVLMHSRFYAGLKRLLKTTVPPPWGEKANLPRLSEEQYERTLREIHAVCNERDVRIIFLTWPLSWQVLLRKASFGYQDIAAKVAASVGAPFVSVATGFIASPDNPYVDVIHGNVQGCAIAARMIAAEVSRLMEGASGGPHE